MNMTVSIPDDLAKSLGERADLSRQMLEALAIESYRLEQLSLGQIAELLELSIDEANTFLKKHRVPLNYSVDDMKHDQEAVEMFLKTQSPTAPCSDRFIGRGPSRSSI